MSSKIRKFNKVNNTKWSTSWEQRGEPASEGLDILKDYLLMDGTPKYANYLDRLKEDGGCLFLLTVVDGVDCSTWVHPDFISYKNNDFTFTDKRLQSKLVDTAVRKFGGVIMIAHDKNSDKLFNKLVFDPKHPDCV